MSSFYHSTIKQTVSAFGSFFSNIHIIRRRGDSKNGPAVQDIRVPIAFSNRAKWIQQIMEGTREKQVKITLPRIAFDITGMSYDATRKKSRNQNITCVDEDGNAQVVKTPVPWNVEIGMYIVSDNIEDCLQIVEQILPQFNPDLTLNVRTVLDLIQPIPISLTSCSFTDSYEGSYTESRLVIYTLTFIAKLDLYGEVFEMPSVTDPGIEFNPENDQDDDQDGIWMQWSGNVSNGIKTVKELKSPEVFVVETDASLRH